MPRLVVTWGEDELVFEQGERGTQFFLLVEGEVSVSWCEGSALLRTAEREAYESDGCFHSRLRLFNVIQVAVHM